MSEYTRQLRRGEYASISLIFFEICQFSTKNAPEFRQFPSKIVNLHMKSPPQFQQFLSNISAGESRIKITINLIFIEKIHRKNPLIFFENCQFSK